MREGFPVTRSDMREYAGEHEVLESLKKRGKAKAKPKSIIPENTVNQLIEKYLGKDIKKLLELT
jgi:hypothetical protein